MAAGEMGFSDKMLLAIESRPWDVLYRAVLGFATLWAFTRLRGPGTSDWLLAPFLLALFLALRVGPAVLRKAFPFSEAVKQVWAERRQLAKRYDSYQWQKLLGFGMGLALYLVVFKPSSMPIVVIAVGCLLAGILGTLLWHVHARQLATSSAQA